jgi:hypothetical protein
MCLALQFTRTGGAGGGGGAPIVVVLKISLHSLKIFRKRQIEIKYKNRNFDNKQILPRSNFVGCS